MEVYNGSFIEFASFRLINHYVLYRNELLEELLQILLDDIEMKIV